MRNSGERVQFPLGLGISGIGQKKLWKSIFRIIFVCYPRGLLGYPKVNVKEFPRASHSNRSELVELALSHQPKVTNEPWHYDYPETWLRSSIFATLPGTIAILHKIELHGFETTNYFLKALDEPNSSRPHDLSNRHPGSPLWKVMNLSYTPRRFVPLPPAVLPPPGQPTTDPIMSGEHRARAASCWR